MLADPKYLAALALHRFGLGPRPGTVPGSIAAVASDPRGALLAELDKPGAGQIVDFDPDDGRQVVDGGVQIPRGAAGRRARQEDGREHRTRPWPTPWRRSRRTPPSRRSPPTRRSRRSPPPRRKPQEPTIQQRIVRGEARARFAAAHAAEIGFVERLVWFWSNHLCVSSFVGAHHGGRLRARGDPPARARPLRRHAARLRGPSGDAGLSRQFALGRAEVGRRTDQQGRPERELRARTARAAYARRAHRLHPGRRHQPRQGAHRLDHPAGRRPTRSTASSSCSTRASTSPARRPCSARPMRISA